MSEARPAAGDERILILLADEGEANSLHAALTEAGLAPVRLRALAELASAIESGQGAAALVDEALLRRPDGPLQQALQRQPGWSEFPLLVLLCAGAESPLPELELPTCLLPLTRPLCHPALLAASRTALRNRRRQHQLRQQLNVLEHQQHVLLASEERLDLALAGAASGFWDIQLLPGRGRRQVYLSEQQKRLIGYAADEVPNSLQAWRHHVLEADRPRLRQALRTALRAGHFEVEYRVHHRDGGIRWLLSRGRVVRDPEGRARRWVGLDSDITERKQAEQELARLAAVVESSQDAIISITMDGRIASWNAAASRMYGYSKAEVRGRPLTMLAAPEAVAAETELLARLRRGERVECTETVRQRRDGSRIHIQRSVSPVTNGDGHTVFASSIERDVSENRRLQARLEHQAFHDTLTGLPNRALFVDRLQHTMDRSQRQRDVDYAVLILDLDNFKVINDSLGHMIGDRLLQEFAGRLRDCLRPGDTLARFGGDEFTLLLEEVDPANVLHVVERIQQALEGTFDLEGHDIKASTSIGIALGHGRYTEPGTLLRDADTALYQAKALGKHRYVIFDQPMRRAAVARMRLESNLRRAISERQLEVHYQPIVDIGCGRIIGCEALARWQDPELGTVSPAEFIPIAEESGLIVPLGKLVLETAAAALADWRLGGVAEGLYVSVNLSTRQIQQADLAEQILGTLQQHQLDGDCLRLEITESIMMNSDEQAIELLAGLRRHGIRICMDDFGTGYSSLSYLREFPFDVLKIDKSFVQSIGSDPATREIVRTVNSLAEGLMLEAIAEGVETPQHLDLLRGLGVRWAQGFHFYRALHPDAMNHLLRQHARANHFEAPRYRH